jgi:hypothetical protein
MFDFSSLAKVVYFGLLILLLIFVLYYFGLFSSRAEKLEGNQIYTAGATMRVLGQQFTSTDQGSNDIVYNDELKNWGDYKKAENFSMPWKPKKNVKI